MKIRKGKKSDKEDIKKIFKIEYKKPPYNDRWKEKELEKEIKSYIKNNIIFIAEKNEKVIGLLIGVIHNDWDGERAKIHEFVISKTHQGKGYGKLMLNEFENYAREKKATRMELRSHKKSTAFKIYKKLGYRENNFVSMEKML